MNSLQCLLVKYTHMSLIIKRAKLLDMCLHIYVLYHWKYFITLGNTPFSDSTQEVVVSTPQRVRSPTPPSRSSGTTSSCLIPSPVQPGIYLMLC